MPKRHRKNKRTSFPPLVPLRYGNVYCELCGLSIKAGAPVAWWRVKRWSGRTHVELRTAYCPRCHTANVREGRALVGSGPRTRESSNGEDAEPGDESEAAGEGTPRSPTPPPDLTLDADRTAA